MNRSPLPTSSAPAASADPGELLSRLADGDCDGTVAPAACARWGAEAEARATWHCYQLIGDVLRSEDLRPSAQGDAAFLAALRERLADEPAIVAPQAVAGAVAAQRATRALPRWAIPGALAAGVVAVAGVALVMRVQTGEGDAARLASLAGPSAAGVSGGIAVGTSHAEAHAAMIRDARLDRYLQAHQGMRVGATAALPGAGLRNVDMLVPSR